MIICQHGVPLFVCRLCMQCIAQLAVRPLHAQDPKAWWAFQADAYYGKRTDA